VQELLFDSFLQTEIPESLKYGTFVGEVRLYTMHAIKTSLKTERFCAHSGLWISQLFWGKVVFACVWRSYRPLCAMLLAVFAMSA